PSAQTWNVPFSAMRSVQIHTRNLPAVRTKGFLKPGREHETSIVEPSQAISPIVPIGWNRSRFLRRVHRNEPERRLNLGANGDHGSAICTYGDIPVVHGVVSDAFRFTADRLKPDLSAGSRPKSLRGLL